MVTETNGRPIITRTAVFTVDSYVVGDISAQHGRLSDTLNNLDQDYLILENVEFGPLQADQGEACHSPYVELSRGSIILAVPQTGKSAAVVKDDLERKRWLWVLKHPHAVFLSVPPFAVRGRLHLLKETQLRDAVLSTRVAFLAVTDAEAIHLPSGERIKGETMLVSRARLAFFCPALLAGEKPE